jgi:hypothetical protein
MRIDATNRESMLRDVVYKLAVDLCNQRWFPFWFWLASLNVGNRRCARNFRLPVIVEYVYRVLNLVLNLVYHGMAEDLEFLNYLLKVNN